MSHPCTPCVHSSGTAQSSTDSHAFLAYILVSVLQRNSPLTPLCRCHGVLCSDPGLWLRILTGNYLPQGFTERGHGESKTKIKPAIRIRRVCKAEHVLPRRPPNLVAAIMNLRKRYKIQNLFCLLVHQVHHHAHPDPTEPKQT